MYFRYSYVVVDGRWRLLIKWAVTDDETKMDVDVDGDGDAKASQRAATAGHSVPKSWDGMCEGLRLHHLASFARILGD